MLFFLCRRFVAKAALKMGSVSAFVLVWLALIVVQLGFGAYGVILVKFAKNKRADPLMFCVIRDGCCFPVLMLASIVSEKRLIIPKLRDIPLFAVLGFFGMFGNQLLYLLGVYYTTADIASIFQPIIPVWTAILAIVTKTERPPPLRKLRGWSKIVGILAATAGAIVMMLIKKEESGKGKDTNGSSDTDLFLGYLFLCGNTFAMGLYVVIQKRYIFNKEDSPWRSVPVTVTAYSYFFGFVFMALASLYYVNTPEKYTNIPKETIFPLIYAIFIASALCYLLITWCNMMASATIVTSSWPLQVLFCIVLAYFILGEVMQPLQYFGGSLIILGLLFLLWSNYKEEQERSATFKLADENDREKLLDNKIFT